MQIDPEVGIPFPCPSKLNQLLVLENFDNLLNVDSNVAVGKRRIARRNDFRNKNQDIENDDIEEETTHYFLR